jgi:hypothetical protein
MLLLAAINLLTHLAWRRVWRKHKPYVEVEPWPVLFERREDCQWTPAAHGC